MHEAPCPNPKLYDKGQCCGGKCLDDIAAATVILNAIRNQDVYIGDDSDLRGVMVDGYLDLVAIASALRTVCAQQRPTSTETNVNEQRTEGDFGMNRQG